MEEELFTLRAPKLNAAPSSAADIPPASDGESDYGSTAEDTVDYEAGAAASAAGEEEEEGDDSVRGRSTMTTNASLPPP